MGLTIAEMKLNPVARAGALAVWAAHPTVRFTSGRRNLWEQAHAMAVNYLLDPQRYLVSQYIHGAALQAWAQAHPEAVSPDQIATGFYALLTSHPEWLASGHLTGDAWDVAPLLDKTGAVTPEGVRVIATIRSLPGLVDFRTHEGSLPRWHARFTPSTEV